MSKYKEIDAIKEKIEELNVLLEQAQAANLILRINLTNNFDHEKQVNINKVVLAEAIYSERII